MGKLFSIIIPCYNTGCIIEETFQSLESQTCKNFEVIFINDGSKDDTLERLYSFQKQSSLDVKIIDIPNGGVSRARNCGLDAATGEYILFLDSDDIYNKEYIEKMYDAVSTTNVDTVYCRISRSLDEVKQFNDKSIQIQHSLEKAMDKLLFEMGKYGFSCYLYRNHLLSKYNIRFDENTKYGEDREFIWKYLCHCNNIIWINAPLYGYRDTPGSALKRTPYERVKGLNAIKRTYLYLKSHGIDYAEKYFGYMYPRSSWALMKNFAIQHNKENFKRAAEELNILDSMKALSNAPDMYVKVLAQCYKIHPMLFYYLVSIIGFIK